MAVRREACPGEASFGDVWNDSDEEEAVVVEDNSEECLQEASGNNILPLMAHHMNHLRMEVIPRVDDLMMVSAVPLYDLIAANLHDFTKVMDLVMGSYLEHLNADEVEQFMVAHRQAGFLAHQIEYCQAMTKTSQPPGVNQYRERVAAFTVGFLQALLRAEEICTKKYEALLAPAEP